MEASSLRSAFVSPIPISHSRPNQASALENRRGNRPCICRFATNNTNSANGSEKNDAGKRDPIAEWVAKARSQSRARRSKNESEIAKATDATNKQRAGAASALDAVDKLFGSAPSFTGDEASTRPVRYSNDNRPVTKEQRQKWLSDLRKEGSQPTPDIGDNGNSNGNASLSDDDSSVTRSKRTPRRIRSRRRRTPRISTEEPLFTAADSDADEGFREAEIDFGKKESGNENSTVNIRSRRRKKASNDVSETRAPPLKNSKTRGTNGNSSVTNSSFSKLLDIARRGAASGSQRNRKPDFDSSFDSLGRDSEDSEQRRGSPSNSNGNNNAKGKVRAKRSSREGSKVNGSTKDSGRGRETIPREQTRRVSRKKSNDRSPVGAVRQLLDMARQIPKNSTQESLRESFKDANALVFEDEDEDVEEYTAKDILRGSGAEGLTKTGRRTFSPRKRRVGGRERRILTPPPDWTPMSEDEIGKVRSESAPLAPKRSIGINIIRDCSECHGTGLEMCTVCVGTGWVEPLGTGNKFAANPKTEALIRDVWERPNLCIHSDGSAQCPHCNGIGKQLCVHCEGSGSAVTRGFDPTQKYIAFDMFQGGRGSPSDDGEVFDEYDESDEEEESGEEVDDDIESMIYTGEVKGYGFSLPLMETSTLESKKPILQHVAEKDDVEVENGDADEPFEFANGVHDEEEDDFTSKPQRRPMLRRFQSLKDEYVPFTNEITAFDELSEDDLAMLNDAPSDEEVDEEVEEEDDGEDDGLDDVAVLEATEVNDVATDDIDLLDDVSADELSILDPTEDDLPILDEDSPADELTLLDDASADQLPIIEDAPADEISLLDGALVDDEDEEEDDALDDVVLVEDEEDSDDVEIAEDEFEFPDGDQDDEEEEEFTTTSEDIEDPAIDLELESSEVLNDGDDDLESADAIFEDDEDADEEGK